MNRSFLIIVLPAIAVGLGYLFVFHWRGFALTPYPFLGAAFLLASALFLVQRYQRRKSARRSR